MFGESAMVGTRFHELPHSGFFRTDFVEEFWLPALAIGKVKTGVGKRPKAPWWLSMLTRVKIKYVVLAIIAGLSWLLVA